MFEITPIKEKKCIESYNNSHCVESKMFTSLLYVSDVELTDEQAIKALRVFVLPMNKRPNVSSSRNYSECIIKYYN